MKNILSKEEIFVRKEIEKIYPQLVINARKVTTTWFDKYGYDLITTAVEFFLNKPIEQQLETIENRKLENFLTYIMNIQFKSSTSKFYVDFRKHTSKIRELYTDYIYKGMDYWMEDSKEERQRDQALECIEKISKELPPFEKMVFDNLIMGQKTFRYCSDKYRISYNHLKDTQTQLKQYINEQCGHCFDSDLGVE